MSLVLFCNAARFSCPYTGLSKDSDYPTRRMFRDRIEGPIDAFADNARRLHRYDGRRGGSLPTGRTVVTPPAEGVLQCRTLRVGGMEQDLSGQAVDIRIENARLAGAFWQ